MNSVQRSRPDVVCALLAGILAALTLVGWLFLVARDDLRATLVGQRPIWWAEQLLVLAQAGVALGIVARRMRLVPLALLLTATILLIGVVRWWQTVATGHVSLPVVWLLNALFFWRLLTSRRSSVVETRVAAG